MSPLPLDPEAVRLSHLVTFAESEGGPLIVMTSPQRRVPLPSPPVGILKLWRTS